MLRRFIPILAILGGFILVTRAVAAPKEGASPAPVCESSGTGEQRRAAVYDPTAGKLPMVIKTIDMPKIGKKQMLVRVKAVALNPLDYKLPTVPMIGKMSAGKVVGVDFSGIVQHVGSEVTSFKAGDKVFGFAQEMTEHGALSPLILAEPQRCTMMPATASFQQAASLPIASVTSLQALRDGGKLSRGDKVLILGASGGCGIAGVQIAKAMGAQVTGVCSEKNAQLVKGLGADRVIDYTTQSVGEALAGEAGSFDVIYDTVTGTSATEYDYHKECLPLLKSKGHYVGINAQPRDWLWFILSKFTGFNLQKKAFQLLMCDSASSTKDLTTVADLVDHKKLTCVLDTTFPFSEEGLSTAFDRLKSRRAVGKIVIEMPEA